MIGQEFLKETINKWALVPHTIMLLGEDGSDFIGACELVATKLGTEIISLDGMISQEIMESANGGTVNQVYIIDSNKIDAREQNILLKSFEEPGEYSYYIIYGNSDYSLLETIKNRCYSLVMGRYTEEELRPLCTKDIDLTLKLCTTPNQVEIANHTDLHALEKFCFNVAESLTKVSLGNAMKISSKINFSDEYSKYDYKLFIRMLCKTYLELGRVNQSLIEHSKWISYMLDKKSYFDNMIIEMWSDANKFTYR